MKLAVAIGLLLLLASCTQPTRTPGDHQYLAVMQEWHQKWEETFWKYHDHTDPRFEQLLDQLRTISVPYPRRAAHSEYVTAHSHFLAAYKYYVYREEIETRSQRRVGSDYIPACDDAIKLLSSTNTLYDFINACRALGQAKEVLFDVRIRWEYKVLK